MVGNGASPIPSTAETACIREGERWYAVHTLPFAEKRAETQLNNQQFRAFLPKRQKTIRHARKLSTVIAPFFPRYLFVVLDLNRHQWRSVNGTFGVSSLVMGGALPRAAPHGVVESMLDLADVEGVLQPQSNLKIGSAVRLAAGPFAELVGVLCRMDDSGRVRVLLDILGRQTTVCLNRSHILPSS